MKALGKVGRPKVTDHSAPLTIYPARSLRERAEAQAGRQGEKLGLYGAKALLRRVEADEAEEKRS